MNHACRWGFPTSSSEGTDCVVIFEPSNKPNKIFWSFEAKMCLLFELLGDSIAKGPGQTCKHC